jgi:hypothetical protein
MFYVIMLVPAAWLAKLVASPVTNMIDKKEVLFALSEDRSFVWSK